MKKILTALAATGALVAVAACGSSDNPAPAPQGNAAAEPSTTASEMPGMPGMSGTPDASASPAAPAAPKGAAVAATSVDIKEFAFGPQSITVKVGATVTWTNDDQDPHTVTSQAGNGPLKSQTLNNGDTFKYTFTKAGTYDYLCTIHPFMTGTVVVTA
jgi:amicyanin